MLNGYNWARYAPTVEADYQAVLKRSTGKQANR
jgi:hypothetical protein